MPARPRLAGAAAAKSHYVSWDELVEEATIDLPPYVLKFSEEEGDEITIPCPNGDQYMNITLAQRIGNAGAIMENLVPDPADLARLRIKMRGASFTIVDILSGQVLSYYFGLTPVDQEKESEGNPDAS